MASNPCHVAALLLSCSLSLTFTAHASDVTAAKAAQPVQIDSSAGSIEPQIVRISYLEGDVRIARGTKGAMWEAAVPGLPIETGFSLATGAGRAEIEFEDSSTVYLDENSVLAFNKLTSADDVPTTEIALLTGTITLNVHPVANEVFALTTPTNRLKARTSSGNYARVTSYLDAMAVTPQEPMTVSTPAIPEPSIPRLAIPGLANSGLANSGLAVAHLDKGQTILYHADGSATAGDHISSEDFAEWDRWVAARVNARAEAISAMMKESGLTAPIPGLADLYGKGTFFACQPYGICWEPTDEAVADAAARSTAVRRARLTPTRPSGSLPVGGFREASLQTVALGFGHNNPSALPGQTSPFGTNPYRANFDFPCYPPGVSASLLRSSGVAGVPYRPYDWALCHAGSWIYRRHYVWVAGTHKHHQCPVHWVKAGRAVAFVPIHPHDVHGKPPINGQHEVFTVMRKGDFSVERGSLDPGARLKMLDEPPRGVRGEYHQPLARVSDPAPEIHRAGVVLAKDSGLREPGTRLTFNHHSQSFTLNKAAMPGSHNMAQLQGFNRSIGSIQSRAGGEGARGGFSGGGGGAHSGGGSSGGSGGGSGHGGGGGVASGGGGGHH
jgi:hypothetical protein